MEVKNNSSWIIQPSELHLSSLSPAHTGAAEISNIFGQSLVAEMSDTCKYHRQTCSVSSVDYLGVAS
jgi:hypothetical protein